MPLPGQMEFSFMAPGPGRRSASGRTARPATPRDASGGTSKADSGPETPPARPKSMSRKRGRDRAEEAA
jgi:hypothetical protein